MNHSQAPCSLYEVQLVVIAFLLVIILGVVEGAVVQ